MAKAASIVLVGCRLPSGIVIEHPADPTKTVLLAGVNRSNIIGATHYVTEVDGEFWADWKKANAKFPPLLSGAIFEADSKEGIAAAAQEVAGEKTGFEQTAQESGGVKPATAGDE